ncbi:MAG TPA: TlpA family protein disulfide reductase [Thermoplasmatales archaeon]|nr:TlpA family protein disulfide reductase [Thermoplasmatales archaeon]
MKHNTLFYLIPVFVLLFTGCTTQDNGSWGDAPDFTLKDVNGNVFTLSDNLGKTVVLDFVTTRCPYCVEEMKDLEKVYDNIGDEVVIVSVVVGGTSDAIRTVYGEYVDKWSFVIDNKGVYQSYQVTGVPKIVIIDKGGNIIYSNSGLTSYNTIMSKIKEAR